MEHLPQGFVEQVARFNKAPCDERSFRALSKQAIDIYEQHPEQGEEVAQLMTGIWFQSAKTWREGPEREIGELFADLDVPPDHVVGGQAGAVSKWTSIRRLVESA